MISLVPWFWWSMKFQFLSVPLFCLGQSQSISSSRSCNPSRCWGVVGQVLVFCCPNCVGRLPHVWCLYVLLPGQMIDSSTTNNLFSTNRWLPQVKSKHVLVKRQRKRGVITHVCCFISHAHALLDVCMVSYRSYPILLADILIVFFFKPHHMRWENTPTPCKFMSHSCCIDV